MMLVSPLVIFVIIGSVHSYILNRNFAATGSDFTLIPGASGEEVALACVKRLENLGVFSNDFGMLSRIAKAESNFGGNYAAKDRSRGIWQLPPSAVNQLSTNATDASVFASIAAIRTYLGDSFVDFNNFDLTVPLHSAIAARLYIDLLLNSNTVPGSLADQASWWAAYYNPGGDSTLFVTTVSNYEATKGCPLKPIDLWILLDGSSSIGAKHFQSALNFINDLSRKFVISATNLQVGLSVYSSASSINIIRSLNDLGSNAAFERAVNSTAYQRGRTYTGAAISDVIDNGFRAANGVRPYAEGVPRVIILLTDGYSSDDVGGPAARAHSAGVTVVSIGVGLGVQTNELNTIASYPPSNFVYTVPEYENLMSTVGERLPMQLCDIPAGLPHGTFTSMNVLTGITQYSYIIIPTSGHVTLLMSATSGSIGIVYLSTLPNPTPSLHLAAIEVVQGIPVTLTVTANAPTSLTRQGVSQALVLTGHDPSAYEIPLYLSLSSQGTNSFRMEMTATYTPPAATTTSTTASTTTASVPVAVAPLETWEVLLIVICACLVFFIIVSIVIITMGVLRSSKTLNWSDNVMFSICCCVLSSAAY